MGVSRELVDQGRGYPVKIAKRGRQKMETSLKRVYLRIGKEKLL